MQNTYRFLVINENLKQTKYHECVLFTSQSSLFNINYFKEFTLKSFYYEAVTLCAYQLRGLFYTVLLNTGIIYLFYLFVATVYFFKLTLWTIKINWHYFTLRACNLNIYRWSVLYKCIMLTSIDKKVRNNYYRLTISWYRVQIKKQDNVSFMVKYLIFLLNRCMVLKQCL